MRFISWNVNGLRAVAKKGFTDIFFAFDADLFALQETKLQEGQIELDLPGYYDYWSYAQRKGYAGTAVFSKQEPLRVLHELGVEELDTEGRIVALEFPKFWFVDVYTPNAQNELARIDHRMAWDDAFRDFCLNLEAGIVPAGAGGQAAQPNIAPAGGQAAQPNITSAGAGGQAARPAQPNIAPAGGRPAQPKPVVMCGDFNVAHNEIDLKNPGPNRGNAGFSDEERGKFNQLLDAGFCDTFRELYPDRAGAYSWWSYRANARANNAGWRIDYFLVSNAIKDCIQSASIFDEVMGSDHCPVGLELDIG